MRVASDAEEDRAAALADVPPPVVSVQALPGYRLQVTFADGLSGEVACAGLIQGPRAGVFAALREREAFERVGVEHGAVTWSCGLDLAPDAMYDEVRRSGRWVIQ
jgi:hypothetical protein